MTTRTAKQMCIHCLCIYHNLFVQLTNCIKGRFTMDSCERLVFKCTVAVVNDV